MSQAAKTPEKINVIIFFMKRTSFLVFMIFISSLLGFRAYAKNSTFKKGTHELGLANLGLAYSSATDLAFSASARYQYFVRNRFSLGGFGFYNSFNNREWMGTGPVASYILFQYERWFSRFDQQLTFAKFNGFSDPPADIYGTSSLGLNYLPEYSNFFIGVGYAHSYALKEGRVLRPNAFQVSAGYFWN